MDRLAPRAGESILEVGVGTGLSAVHYPRDCRVTAIDLSGAMLDRARARIVRHGTTHVRLCRMDAAHLAFRDAQFDAVYAPYVLNVVPDPVVVAREMLRVCRPHGRLVLLNHFDHAATRNIVNRIVGWMAGMVSDVNWNLDLDRLLHEAGLVAVEIEPVNVPRVSCVVLCRAG
jgi:phosphatidylethanolamine/phosphatidyl-N-methylethanolamine N-methyltransferase